MKINDIPEFRDKKHVLTLGQETLVLDAVKKMVARNYGSVVIVEKKKIIGMFTERDLLKKVVALDLHPSEVKVKDVMTTDVKVATVDDDIVDCMRRMSQGRFRHLPIVDKKGELLGLLSQGDFATLTWGHLYSHFKNFAKINFSINTQIWMLVIAFVVYSLAMTFLLTQ